MFYIHVLITMKNVEIRQHNLFHGFLTAKRSGETKNMLHCNWGWGGSRNGYYLSKAFNTFYGAEILDDISEGHNDKNCNYNYKYDLQYSIISR